MNSSIRSILHPTDFSDLSSVAFAHALRIALSTRSKLHLLHIVKDEASEALVFPHVRRLLSQWGFLEQDDPSASILTTLGLEIESISVKSPDPTQGIVGYLNQHQCDLVVLATHGRDGIEHLMKGSVAEAVFRRRPIPTLFVARGARGLVSQISGDFRLERVLIPIDVSPAPANAVEGIRKFAEALTSANITMLFLHIGHSSPHLDIASSNIQPVPQVILRRGNVVDSIIEAAVEFDVDIIGMPTEGHHGVLDALRGSTTQRVIRHAACPVLAIPVK